MRYGIRTRILRFLALRHGALTFRPNAHNRKKPVHMLADLYLRCAQAPGGRNPSLLPVSKIGTDGGIRTRTGQGLSLLPLPIALHPHKDRAPGYLALPSLTRLSRTSEFMLPYRHTIVSPQSTPLWLVCWGLSQPSIPKLVP